MEADMRLALLVMTWRLTWRLTWGLTYVRLTGPWRLTVSIS